MHAPSAVAQVIVHRPFGIGGQFRCENWTSLPFARPAMISVIPISTSTTAVGHAQRLADGLTRALFRMSPSAKNSACNGPGPASCRGHYQTASPCVLALVGDGGPFTDFSGAVARWSALAGKDPRYRIVPICQPSGRSAMLGVLPSVIGNRKIFEWTLDAADAVPAVLGAAEIVSRDYRIFISYRQEDGQEHADDLFQALSYSGFDVFLDRVRIGAGSLIPDRIREELAHKSMLLVLETPLVYKSAWVAQEVAIATRSRLGRLALHFPGGTSIPSLSSRRRFVLDPKKHFDSCTKRLTVDGIQEITRRVLNLHSVWLVRKRYQMQRALSNFLIDRGLKNHRLNGDGTLDVVAAWNPKTVCSIRTNPRMAELEDFRDLDNSSAPPEKWQRAVLAPGTLAGGERQINMRWLSGNLRAGLFDESEMKRLSDLLASSTATELK